MKIRIATLDDVPQLARLNRTVQNLHAQAAPKLFRVDAPQDLVEAGFRDMVSDPTAFCLVAEKGEPVGYLYATFRYRAETWFRPAHRICNISHVSVEREHQRRGIGRALFERLFQEAASRGYERIELDVWSFNVEAREAFERLGFRVFNERMVYAPDA